MNPVAWFVMDAAGHRSLFTDEQEAHSFAEWANGGGRFVRELYTADQLRQAQVKVLREAAKEAALDGGTAYVAAWLRRMADELSHE